MNLSNLSPLATDGTPRQDLRELVELFTSVPKGADLDWYTRFTQQNWVAPGQDRTMLPYVQPRVPVSDAEIREAIWPLGAIEAQTPLPVFDFENERVRIAVQVGGGVRPARLKAQDIMHLVDAEAIDMAIWLGGRTVNPKIDNLDLLCDPSIAPIREGWVAPESLGKNELDWLPSVVDQFDLYSKLGELYQPQFLGGASSAQEQLPALQAYIQERTAGAPVEVVIVTINPHWGFHSLMWRRLLQPYGYRVITRAVSAMRGKHTTEYLLDGVGRWLHEYNKFIQAGLSL